MLETVTRLTNNIPRSKILTKQEFIDSLSEFEQKENRGKIITITIKDKVMTMKYNPSITNYNNHDLIEIIVRLQISHESLDEFESFCIEALGELSE